MDVPYRNFKHLSTFERAKIELLNKQGESLAQIARALGRAKSAVHYELHRYKNPALYQARVAQIRANCAKKNSRKPSKAANHELMANIELMIKKRWSPEIIAHKLKGISHMTIYSIIKTCRPEWKKYLIYRKKTRYHKGSAGKALIPDRMDISERPNVAYGDWEADTVISARCGKSCLGVFAERTTRLYRVVKMANKTADGMVKAAITALSGLPVRSITYDNGTENAKHGDINRLLGCVSWFCRPYRSGDKGLVENRNRWLRVYMPKRTNIDLISEKELNIIETAINERPMKCLGWLSPASAFHSANRSI
jgi:IS30 family transposase